MRRTTTLSQDERAIEGLPIRLVIALVVGVASLAIMMQMLGTFGFNTSQEVTVEFRSSSLESLDSSGKTSEAVKLTVVTTEGDPVPNAQVLITSGTLTLENNPHTISSSTGPKTTGENGQIATDNKVCAPSATGSGGGCPSGAPKVDFRSDQDKGTLKFDIVLRGDGNFEDKKPNPELVVTQ